LIKECVLHGSVKHKEEFNGKICPEYFNELLEKVKKKG
jgi:hypothetical protein